MAGQSNTLIQMHRMADQSNTRVTASTRSQTNSADACFILVFLSMVWEVICERCRTVLGMPRQLPDGTPGRVARTGRAAWIRALQCRSRRSLAQTPANPLAATTGRLCLRSAVPRDVPCLHASDQWSNVANPVATTITVTTITAPQPFLLCTL